MDSCHYISTIDSCTREDTNPTIREQPTLLEAILGQRSRTCFTYPLSAPGRLLHLTRLSVDSRDMSNDVPSTRIDIQDESKDLRAFGKELEDRVKIEPVLQLNTDR